ncbi:MAG TPA: DUF222 domain-containing protein, partial [Nocardioidaceae bacterium]|nr:DUF222 domain-containing protein [Nocardioidaceae bacterium]
MFDPSAYTTLRQNAAALAAAREDTALATGQQLCDALREVQVGIDMLEGVRADLLARLEASDGYAEEGASTTSSWARKELRMGLGESRKNCRAGQTLQLLPAVAQALAEGRIRAAHVYEFTAGVTKLGADVMADLEDILLPVAESNDPSEVKAAISALHEILHPDELDKQYARGMERKDFKATRCGEGYHVTGFLDILTGAKVSAWLKDVSGPEYEGDDRTPGQRRVDALARLIDQAITLVSDQAPSTDHPGVSGDASEGSDASETGGATETGETTDTGATPQPAGAQQQRPRRDTRLLVLADLESLLRRPGAEPATLAGFGHIGEQLLGYLTCGSDVTGILTDGLSDGATPQANVLNVGRTHRLATRAQRDAILARQDGICAAPGCGLTYLEFHHVEWWERDAGRTDLDNLVGICNRCHHRVHQNRLVITRDGSGGFVFTRRNGRVIDDHAKVTKQRVREIIALIRH